MRRRLPALLLWGSLCLCLARPAVADAEHDRCIAASDGTNTSWATCGADLLKREDGRLNGAWKRVFAGLPDETRKNLLDEQRAWNAFKETSCLFYRSDDWGREGQVLHFPLCRAAVIAERVKALEGYGTFFKQ